MDKALILHGWRWDSKENWFPWLKKELNKKLFDVYIPNLPSTHKPVLEEQLDCINVYSSDFKEDSLIVWHSLWWQLALAFIEENNIKDSLIIMVAPTYDKTIKEVWKDIAWESYDYLVDYNESKIDFQKINKLNNKFIIFLSDNDPYINMENAKNYYKKLENVNFVEFKNKWHFNQSAWIYEIPEILKYLPMDDLTKYY
mgnify:CR=1 FL=1